ncbi:endonuclease [Candidatus Woesebacteria bacterium RIFCSPHIGHO2_01_FULL_39_17]|uniref:Endonuclease n=1 Tax=Candidatus Woesebacteria bacterium RIFCSPLOWO2_01_FULL_39_14 TaxID=1802518 RepID=A0A1F8BHZ9_9BACT|nr:MAG: endonuclease [Candidatus Woesebacteria bacterium RIFCSPHIGHO2_01_FULL_39_17]OGM63590.1 MAG: endonuclease [Candidatus Woesebacteria bacterium RIFCSPLOWO2_01_FULL_39_14]
MYFVYVLKSLTNGRFYTGSTSNLERRLNEHNLGKSKYTRLTKPFNLIYKEEYKTRVEAYKRELFFKTGKGRELLKILIKQS